ncbi:flavonoid 3'-monooxygenase [Phtheirospermum japonicum]|uniref:Flavonoid 3'-monooxygenase n=1 Tax=Phtheirospermum japonicum TaxID=374723 RepID=A0A830CXE1_9LAMI|nr:flavonoid 3'-monooxygenase [Phtheirospermum japonicum]
MDTTLSLITSTAIAGLLIYFYFQKKRHISKGRPPLPPGPRPWPIVGNLLQLGPKPHESMAALARVHGPLLHLKMGFVHVVVAVSASVAEQFLKVHDGNFSSRPPSSGAKHMAYNYQDLVFASYGPRWRLLRKICALHLFSTKALDDFKHVRQEEVGILTRTLASVGHTSASIGKMLNVCTTNAIARVMIGRRVVDHGFDAKAEEFKAMVVELMVLAGVFNVGDFIPPLEGFDLQGVTAKMKKLHARFDAFLTAILEDHKIKGSYGTEGQLDLLTTLVSLKDVDDAQGGRLTDTEIKALLLVRVCFLFFVFFLLLLCE